MNERIKQLLAQAHGEAENLQDTNWIATRFAELIVADIAELCDEEKEEYNKFRKSAWDFEEKNIYAEGEAACDTIKYKMRRHFGVK
jgi:hypothetical protein